MARGGYRSWQKVVESMKPEQLIDEVKASGLRGRGGAGFPTGMKWSFVPKDNPKPKYLVCNADESEPGTFKDRLLIEQDPHAIIEGTLIAAYAIQSHTAFIYIRGEMVFGATRLEQRRRGSLSSRLHRQKYFWLRLRLGRDRPSWRGRLYLRRRNRAAVVLGRRPRLAQGETAVSGDPRPVRLSDGGEQCRDAGGLALDYRARRGCLRGHGHGEEQRHEALQRQRSYRAGPASTNWKWVIRSRNFSKKIAAACPTAKNSKASFPAAVRCPCCCPTRLKK